MSVDEPRQGNSLKTAQVDGELLVWSTLPIHREPVVGHGSNPGVLAFPEHVGGREVRQLCIGGGRFDGFCAACKIAWIIMHCLDYDVFESDLD